MADKLKTTPPLLGAHFSIAKGLHNALREAEAYGCNTLQMFTKNAATWKERRVTQAELDLFARTMKETGISSVFSHTAYLINLAAIEEKKFAMSCGALENEMLRSKALCIPHVVLHPGAHLGMGESGAIRRIAESVNRMFDRLPDDAPQLLLETTAGQGSSVGHRFEQLAEIMDRIERKTHVGICLDTCHIFAAGYDIRTRPVYLNTMKRFGAILGMDHLQLIHLNDSKRGLGSRVDRHAHIGKGCIGLAAFGFFMNDKRLRNTPKIIETEKGTDGTDWDRINLECLRGLIKKRPGIRT